MQKILHFLNTTFKQKLIDFGYPDTDDLCFDVEAAELITLTDRIAIDVQVAQQVKIHPEYWYKKYNVPMPDGGAVAADSEREPDAPPPDPKKKSR